MKEPLSCFDGGEGGLICTEQYGGKAAGSKEEALSENGSMVAAPTRPSSSEDGG